MKPGEFPMSYLRSRTDGSVQPYGFWAPGDYTPGKKFELLIMGGAGSWLVGLRHPDQFGSVTPIDAAMGFGNNVDNSTELLAWLQPQVAALPAR